MSIYDAKLVEQELHSKDAARPIGVLFTWIEGDEWEWTYEFDSFTKGKDVQYQITMRVKKPMQGVAECSCPDGVFRGKIAFVLDGKGIGGCKHLREFSLQISSLLLEKLGETE